MRRPRRFRCSTSAATSRRFAATPPSGATTSSLSRDGRPAADARADRRVRGAGRRPPRYSQNPDALAGARAAGSRRSAAARPSRSPSCAPSSADASRRRRWCAGTQSLLRRGALAGELLALALCPLLRTPCEQALGALDRDPHAGYPLQGRLRGPRSLQRRLLPHRRPDLRRRAQRARRRPSAIGPSPTATGPRKTMPPYRIDR